MPESSQGKDSTASRKSPTILLVEDDPNSVRLARMLLEKDGYTVQAASNGAEALEALNKFVADVLLLDVGLPDMSGYEVCRIIKDDERLKKIPVVFLTAHGSPRDYQTGGELGAVFYIAKPYNPKHLLQVIHSLAPPAQTKS